MINVPPKNSKLAARGVSILQRAADVDRKTAREALKKAGNSVPVALVMLEAAVNRRDAGRALQSSDGHVRQAIAAARSM
jgi:N-acetylmuramic acid 6-phosphate etherase